MDIHTNTMSQTVVEVFAVAGRRDQAAGGSVKVAEPHAGLDKRLGGLVGTAHDVVDARRIENTGIGSVDNRLPSTSLTIVSR